MTIPIRGGNNENSENGSERKPSGFGEGSETNTKSSETGSGTSIQQVTSEKHIFLRFKCDFCKKTTKIALKNGLNIDGGLLSLSNQRDLKGNDRDNKSGNIGRNLMYPEQDSRLKVVNIDRFWGWQGVRHLSFEAFLCKLSTIKGQLVKTVSLFPFSVYSVKVT